MARGRPTGKESQQLDEGIKSVALELFLERGYEATTMEAVAAAAGITKRTLYKRYRDKAALFSAALRKSREEWSAPELEMAGRCGAALEEELLALANALLAQALNPRTIKLARIAAAKSEQFPQEITESYDISLSPRIASVAAVLERHRVEIAPDFRDDLPVLAELFVGIITGIPARLAGYGKLRGIQVESRRIALAVELFARGIIAS